MAFMLSTLTARIAEGVLATPRLPAEIAEILARTGDGNPFYVEEVILCSPAAFLNTLGWLYMQCHALDAGLAFSTRGLEIARRSRHATGFERVAFNLADQADAFLSRGDLALASDVLDETVRLVQHPPASRWISPSARRPTVDARRVS